MLESAVSVKQLNYYVKSILESDQRLSYISVEGEISNFKNHYANGHWYFTIKDNDAAIRCVMFRSYAQKVNFEPEDGMHIIISGRVSLYEKDGQYQFYADKMTVYGEGNLALEFRLVKEKLEKEGLFDESTKRQINKNPKRIAVVTSNSGAALHDILTTLEKRRPFCEVVVCPVTVQGTSAPGSIIETLEKVYTLCDIDTIIIARGGGSFEDLSCFNDEALARKIYESPVPVISGVGHETDFTICDFVSDLRAATPTAAAVCATCDMGEISEKILKYDSMIKKSISAIIEKNEYRLKVASSSRFLKNPMMIFDSKMQEADFLSRRLSDSMKKKYTSEENKYLHLIDMLDSLSPLKTLQRGFAIAEKNGKVVESKKDITPGDDLTIRLKDGTIGCTVKENTNE